MIFWACCWKSRCVEKRSQTRPLGLQTNRHDLFRSGWRRVSEENLVFVYQDCRTHFFIGLSFVGILLFLELLPFLRSDLRTEAVTASSEVAIFLKRSFLRSLGVDILNLLVMSFFAQIETNVTKSSEPLWHSHPHDFLLQLPHVHAQS